MNHPVCVRAVGKYPEYLHSHNYGQSCVQYGKFYRYPKLKAILFIINSILLVIFLFSTVKAEHNSNEEIPPQKRILTTYYKGIDYDGLQNVMHVDKLFTNGGKLRCREEFSLYLYRFHGLSERWKIDQKLYLSYEKPINDKVGWLSAGTFDLFNVLFEKEKTSGKAFRSSEMITGYLAQGLAYNNHDLFKVKGLIGPLRDQRRSRKNNGIHLDCSLFREYATGTIHSDGWLNRFSFGNDYGWSMDLKGKYDFIDGGSDSYNVLFNGSNQREYIGDNRGWRADEQFNIVNRLATKDDVPIQVSWNSDLNRQRTTHTGLAREYQDYDFSWKNDMQLIYRSSGFGAIATGGLDLQEQRYDEALAQGRRNYLGLYVVENGSVLDSAALNARVIKYRYDTPDVTDFNDRDELRYLIALSAGKMITSNLGLILKLEADLRHLVYISARRSGENRWGRVFSLSCKLPWRDGRLENVADFAVVTNYTVYDFPDADAEKSRIYRFFTFEDTLLYDLNSHFNLEFHLALILDEHGRFHWGKWVEEVSENGYSLSASVIPSYRSDDITMGFGWKTNHRYSWRHQTDEQKVRGESVQSHGPVGMLIITPSDRLHAELKGSVLMVKDRFRGSYNLPDIKCSLTWLF